MGPRPHSFTYGDCTDKLMQQFEPRPEAVTLLMTEGFTEAEAVERLSVTAADSFCDSLGPAEAALFFSAWNRSLRAQCSDEFRALRDEHPDWSPDAIKQHERLQRLNGIRRGVRWAMQRQYGIASAASPRR